MRLPPLPHESTSRFVFSRLFSSTRTSRNRLFVAALLRQLGARRSLAHWHKVWRRNVTTGILKQVLPATMFDAEISFK